ncbi:glutaminase [Alcaligenaceae bacterium A4P071]|nr:glutaminase [Alcaligenaceae bacterium B3P038]MDQ2187426.1 glutaminase [Alcaligenaceae bacterium A4P071]
MNIQEVLDDITATLRPELGQSGKVADYIPALARVPAEQFGIAVRTAKGQEYASGDCDVPFSIQSISKLFSLTLAMRAMGDDLWTRIGREPSGNPFNSLVQLEREEGVPRNPFINAGALAVADRLVTCGDGLDDILAFLSSLSGDAIGIDEEVAESEAATGFRNAALANFMKSFDKLDNDVAAVLHVYFRQCAIVMNCRQLARAAAYLARDGVHPRQKTAVLSDRQARRVNALMLTCGTYDAAGEFAFRVGLPCKSGVGGGIVAVVPDKLSLCVWSPALDESGNSVLGMRALELFVANTGMSVF